MTLYNHRKVLTSQHAGYFAKHSTALTREVLHYKGEIAAELGWRDMLIDELQLEVAALKEELKQAQAARDEAYDAGYGAGIVAGTQ